MSAELQASRRDATLILTLSNPGTNNALHPDMYAAAIETLTTAERDDTVRAVVLTGADGNFCSGERLNRLTDERARVETESLTRFHGWLEAIRDCPKPVIAAVEGMATDAGFSLALACDLVVAAASAGFAMDRVKTGIVPSGGGTWFLMQALPHQLALEILLEGKPVPASRLQQLGIVNRVVADGAALDTALAWADTLSALPADALERIKSLAQDAKRNTLAEHMEAEQRHIVESLLRSGVPDANSTRRNQAP
jgi:enoyl-CoA hydratase/carnithine racemase